MGLVLTALNELPAKICAECAHLLIHEDRLEDLKRRVALLVSHHKASSELLLWLAKEPPDSFADILGPEVFRAMLTAMERDQFNEKRSNRLRDFILDDQELLVELIGAADLEVIKDLTRALQYSPSFDDMDKRSLLARIVKSYPAIQSLISGEQTKQDTYFIVSWESLERRKNEYAARPSRCWSRYRARCTVWPWILCMTAQEESPAPSGNNGRAIFAKLQKESS